jgi:hypothetical protein
VEELELLVVRLALVGRAQPVCGQQGQDQREGHVGGQAGLQVAAGAGEAGDGDGGLWGGEQAQEGGLVWVEVGGWRDDWVGVGGHLGN